MLFLSTWLELTQASYFHLGEEHTQSLSRVQLFVTSWIVAHQAPLSMEFFRKEILEWVAISFSMGEERNWQLPSDDTEVKHLLPMILCYRAT